MERGKLLGLGIIGAGLLIEAGKSTQVTLAPQQQSSTQTGSLDKEAIASYAPGAKWYWGMSTLGSIVAIGVGLTAATPFTIGIGGSAILRFRCGTCMGGGVATITRQSSGIDYGAVTLPPGGTDGTSSSFTLLAGEYVFSFNGPDVINPRWTLTWST